MYTSFDSSEEIEYDWSEQVKVIEEIGRRMYREIEEEINLRRSIAELCEYGTRVGFTSIEFYSACEKTFVNADKSIALLERNGVETVDEFVMFVRGCGHILCNK